MSQPPRVGPSTGATTTPSAKTRHGHAAFLRWESFEQNRLREGLKRAAACALHGAREQDHSQAGGRSAGERRHREDDDAE